jgi:hypothetical protein
MTLRSVLVVLGLSVLGVGATTAAEPTYCANGSFPKMENVRMARATPDASGKVRFRNDGEGCPAKPSCAGKVYVVAGDELLMSQEVNGWVCAWYFSKKREYVGWIRPSEAKAEPTRTPNLADWTGDWSASADINIERLRDGSLHVTGTALWYGLKNDAGEQVVHDGELDDSARPVGDRLEIGDPNEEYGCRVVFTLVNGYLLAKDNGYCGGMNVSFTDVYRRAPKAKSAPR